MLLPVGKIGSIGLPHTRPTGVAEPSFTWFTNGKAWTINGVYFASTPKGQ